MSSLDTSGSSTAAARSAPAQPAEARGGAARPGQGTGFIDVESDSTPRKGPRQQPDAERASPDPLHATDRYRLTIPFVDRIR